MNQMTERLVTDEQESEDGEIELETMDAEKEIVLETTRSTHSLPKGRLLSLLAFLYLGSSYLIPFHALLLTVDFFDLFNKDWHVPFLFSVIYFIPNMAIMLLLVFFFRENLKIKIVASYVGFTVILIVFPVMLLLSPSYISFIALSILIGCCDAVAQSSVVGYACYLPYPFGGKENENHWVRMILLGNACSGVVVAIIKIVIKASARSDDILESVRLSSTIFLAVSSVLMLFTAFLFLMLPRIEVIRICLEHAVKREKEDQDSQISGKEALSKLSGTWEVLKVVKLHVVLTIVTFALTLFIYPGIASEFASSGMIPKDWISVVMLTSFNCGDLVGRLSTNYFPTVKNKVLNAGLCLSRLVFAPIFFLCLPSIAIVRQELVPLGLLFLFGLSGGFCGTINVSMAPALVSQQNKEIVGNIMSFSILFGLASGAFLSFLASKIFSGLV